MEDLIYEIDDLEKVAEPLRALYADAGDGKFRLKLTGLPQQTGEDVSGLKSALEKERKAREDFEKQLRKFKDVDPEKYRQLVRERDEAERRKHEESGNFQELIRQTKERAEAEINARDEENQRIKRRAEKQAFKSAAMAAIEKANGISRILLKEMEPHIKVIERDDDDYDVIVVDERGNPRIGDGRGNPMTLDQLVDELRGDPDLRGAFRGNPNTGGGMRPDGQPGAKPGAPGGNGGPAAQPPLGFTRTYSAEEKVKLQQQVGAEAYRDLVTRDLRALQAARHQQGAGQGLPARG
jgi:hypothetical protein